MTTYLTIDAGIAFKLIAPHPHRQLYVELVSQWQQEDYQLCAPTLWVYEITSAFAKMAHFGHLSSEISREGLDLALRLNVELVSPDIGMARRAFAWTEQLQRAAAYDSFYLALAEARGCDLWTVDKRVVRAVDEPWVKLVEEPDS